MSSFLNPFHGTYSFGSSERSYIFIFDQLDNFCLFKQRSYNKKTKLIVLDQEPMQSHQLQLIKRHILVTCNNYYLVRFLCIRFSNSERNCFEIPESK